MMIYCRCCFDLSVCRCHGSLPQAVLAIGVFRSTDIAFLHWLSVAVLAVRYLVAEIFWKYSLLFSPVNCQRNILLFDEEVTLFNCSARVCTEGSGPVCLVA